MFPANGKESLESWLEAYHSANNIANMRRGNIQAAVCIEMPGLYCDGAFEDFHLQIEGPNGLLPNLDLINTIVKLGDQRGVEICVSSQSSTRGWLSSSTYQGKIFNLLTMCFRQALGYPEHSNGPFLKYKVICCCLYSSLGQIPYRFGCNEG